MSEQADIQAHERDARRYARARYALFVAELALGIAFTAYLLADGTFRLGEFARWASADGGLLWQAFFYYAAFFVLYFIISLPLGFFRGYALEHRFKLSTENVGRWLWRRAKRRLVSFVISAPLFVALVALIEWRNDWWFWAAVGWLFVSYGLARVGPRILLPLFYKLTPLDDAALVERLAKLAGDAKLSLAGVFRVDFSRETKKANAAVAGFGKHRRVILADTLLDNFTREEIGVVFAHELGHIVHRDLLLGFCVSGAVSFGALFLANITINAAAQRLGIQYTYELLPVLIAVFGVIQFVVMPFVNALSRWRERECDRHAIRTTGDAPSFISAMEKLAQMNLADVKPNRLVEILLFDHPPIEKRIAFARNMETPQ